MTTNDVGSATTPPPNVVKRAEQVRQAYSAFVGETFFGQMLKSMRSTVGKPAYFHGGQAEETFRSQLDGELSKELSKSSADRFADPIFEQQFPQEAAVLKQAGVWGQSSSVESLAQLRELRY
jgi:Rod binding domain-containing protein